MTTLLQLGVYANIHNYLYAWDFNKMFDIYTSQWCQEDVETLFAFKVTFFLSKMLLKTIES